MKILPNSKTVCHNCGGFAESGGVKSDRILTRNSDRVREQQHQHEGDMITPYVWDKGANQVVANPDFIELYPDQSAVTYTDAELATSGHSRLKQELSQQEVDNNDDVSFSGDEKQGIKEILDGEAG